MKDKTYRVLSVEDNPVSAELVRVLLAGAHNNLFEVESANTLIGALDRLASGGIDVVLLDLGLPDSDGLGTLTTIRTHEPDVPVLVLTASDSDSLAKDALAHGAQDYIVKGQFDGNSLSRSLRYAILRAQRDPGQANDQTRPSRARVIGVMGAKGGTGTTAVAIHLAVDIRRQTGKEILLVDLDVSGGSVGFLMKVDRPYTLQDASLNLHRLDAALWQSFVSRHESGVDVLQSAGSIRFGEQLREERVRHLLRLVQMQYAWIILDMGRLTELSLALLEEVGELALVTTPDVSSLQEVRKIVQKLLGTGYDPDRLSLIMNRASRSDISKGDLEKTIGSPVRFCLPDSGGELDDAYASGELQPAHSSFGKQISKVAASLTGIVPTEAKRWTLFGRSLATPSMQAGR